MRRSMMGRKKAGISIDGAPNGIYVLRTDDKLYTQEMWKTDWNNEAVGVAVVTGNCKFVISKTQGGSMTWGGYGTTISGIVTTDDENTAKKDYAGKDNTDKIIAQLGASSAPAANYCKNTSGLFPDGRQGYLGSCGEWQEAYNNKSEIDACMSLIGGTVITKKNYHWTSTQCDSRFAWPMGWSTEYTEWDHKNSNHQVRAFAAL